MHSGDIEWPLGTSASPMAASPPTHEQLLGNSQLPRCLHHHSSSRAREVAGGVVSAPPDVNPEYGSSSCHILLIYSMLAMLRRVPLVGDSQLLHGSFVHTHQPLASMNHHALHVIHVSNPGQLQNERRAFPDQLLLLLLFVNTPSTPRVPPCGQHQLLTTRQTVPCNYTPLPSCLSTHL